MLPQNPGQGNLVVRDGLFKLTLLTQERTKVDVLVQTRASVVLLLRCSELPRVQGLDHALHYRGCCMHADDSAGAGTAVTFNGLTTSAFR